MPALHRMFSKYPDVVTIDQMNEMLSICRKTSEALLRANKIRHFKIGHKYRIPKKYVIDYIKESTE